VAFGVVFALTASVGPIIGQNYGAKLMARVQRTLTDSFILSIGYVLFAWAVLALAAPALIGAFEARGESAQYLAFYCRYGVVAWIFLACLFVANVSFNNLGFPVLSMAFNWARATLGTIPFVTVGAGYGGVQGGMLGFALGAAVFGLIAVATAYVVTWRLAKAIDGGGRAGLRPAAAIEGRGAKTP
jgi:Na+-driven multidrug efflux pump